MKKSIFILGANGFVGKNLFRYFNYRRIKLKKLLNTKSFLLKSNTGLINCAAYNISREKKIKDYKKYFNQNIKIILDVLDIAHKKKLNYVIFFSSILVNYKDNQFNSVLKRIEEIILSFYSSQLNVNLIIIRVPNLFGLKSKKGTVFHKLAKLKKGYKTKFGQLNSKITPMNVDELSSLVYRITQTPKKYIGKIIEIDNIKRITIKYAINLIKNKDQKLLKLPKKRFKFLKSNSQLKLLKNL